MHVREGDFVEVPLASKKVVGIVWDELETRGEGVNPKKVREIIQRYDCPPMADKTRRFIEWVANYTLAPLGMVMRMTARMPGGLNRLSHLPWRRHAWLLKIPGL